MNRYEPSPEDQVLVRQIEAWSQANVGGEDLRQWFEERGESFAMFRELRQNTVTSEVMNELPFGRMIRRIAKEYDVDPLLLAAIIEVESGFDPQVVSARGAVGLLQVMPTTAEADSEHLHHPEHNLRAGARYLKRLKRRYDGDIVLTLAAYNAGPGNVRRYRGVPPFRETQAYVDKVLERYLDHLRGLLHPVRMIDQVNPAWTIDQTIDSAAPAV